MPDHSSSQTPYTPFVELQSVDSTNNYARGLVKDGSARHGMAFFAQEQLVGKGQRGRKWLSEKGSNIILTILLNPHPLRVSEQFHLNTMIAVILREFFSKYAGEETKIKWPNDLYWQDRKAGGVLVESVIGPAVPGDMVETHENASQDNPIGDLLETDLSETHIHASLPKTNWKWAIVGIGININQTVFSDDLKNPVSLKKITGKDFNVIDLAKELSECVIKNFNLLKEKGFENFMKLYNNHLYKKGETVKFKKDNRVFEATIKSVDSTGKLHIQHAIEEEISFGNLEWLI